MLQRWSVHAGPGASAGQTQHHTHMDTFREHMCIPRMPKVCGAPENMVPDAWVGKCVWIWRPRCKVGCGTQGGLAPRISVAVKDQEYEWGGGEGGLCVLTGEACVSE